MSTPIEIIRAELAWRNDPSPTMRHTYSVLEIDDALFSVLRSAERFQALKDRTFGHTHYLGMSRDDGNGHILVWGEGRTLADLADNLLATP